MNSQVPIQTISITSISTGAVTFPPNHYGKISSASDSIIFMLVLSSQFFPTDNTYTIDFSFHITYVGEAKRGTTTNSGPSSVTLSKSLTLRKSPKIDSPLTENNNDSSGSQSSQTALYLGIIGALCGIIV